MAHGCLRNVQMCEQATQLISFVIPCYCSKGSVGLVIDEIREVVSQRDGYDYEVVAVNDCSPDGTLEALRAVTKKDTRVTAIDLARNGGRHSALMCGCHYVSGDYVVFVDDDQQCPLDRLWDLLEPLMDGSADVAIARYPQKKQSWFKNLGSRVNDVGATWLLGKSSDLKFSNFSAMKRFVRDEVIKYTNPYPYLSGLMFRSTSRVVNVDMEERERTIGEGHYTFRKSLSLLVNSFTSFSVKPLRLATFLGILFAVLGFLFGLFVVVRKLLHPQIAMGWSSTMAAIMLIGGMIMLMLGIIGEYLGRIYISLNNSPQFVVREVFGPARDSESER